MSQFKGCFTYSSKWRNRNVVLNQIVDREVGFREILLMMDTRGRRSEYNVDSGVSMVGNRRNTIQNRKKDINV